MLVFDTTTHLLVIDPVTCTAAGFVETYLKGGEYEAVAIAAVVAPVTVMIERDQDG